MSASIPQKQFDIIGGGLAGSLLSYRLLQLGHSVRLWEAHNPASASRTAAGLFNVITGRFGAKTWMAETLLESLKRLFAQAPFNEFNNCLHYAPIYRPFKEIAEYNKWTGRISDPAFQHLVRFEEQGLCQEVLHNELGGITILPCGWLALSELIDQLHSWLQTQADFQLIPTHLSPNQINIAGKRILFEESQYRTDELVYCVGQAHRQHPVWASVPVIPNKGETLRIHAPELQLPFVLSRKIYLIPLPSEADQYLIGSTYQKTFSDAAPSAEGRAEIEYHLQQAIKVPYEILAHKAGIRPTTPNRRPILGTHPHYPYVHAFTGFGTKGVLLGAHFSEVMAKYLTQADISLPKEVNLARFR